MTKTSKHILPWLISLITAILLMSGVFAVKASAEVSGDYTYTVTGGKATITEYNGTATEITIPSELDGYPVTSIGNYAFSYCTGLTSVIIPNSVTRIGSDAFYGCTGLTSITIPNSVTSIGDSAFRECTGLTSVIIPNSVTRIGSDAFYDCTGLTSVIIPNSVTSIREFAFSGCTGLTSITIPNSVTSLGWSAFSRCTGLTSVIIPNSVTYIGDYAFSGCTGLTSITIPNSVTKIEDGAFKGCTNLTSITIPDSVTFVGNNAFYETGIYNDESNWENGILYIGNYLINSKDSLTSASIKDGTVLIADSAFKERTGLTSVTIPDSVTSINDYAFYKCAGLTSVTIGDSVTSIGHWAFMDCTGLTSITIPDSVTSIGNQAFRGCTNLTSITIGNGVTTIGPLAFDGTGFYNNQSNWENDILYIGNYLIDSKNSLTSASIKEGTVLIADYAFEDCTGLTSVTIPNSVTSIGDGAFDDCTGLTSVTIPNSVTSIGNFAFNGCTGLTSVTIPNSVTSIGNQTFILCTGLTSVIIPNSVTSIGNSAFFFCSRLTSITIPNSVTSIGEGAFGSCTGLTSVTIPNSVTSIGDNAFYGCRNLTSIFLPNTVDVSNAGISGSATQIRYTVSDGKVTVTGVTLGGGQSSLTIPETIDGKPVTVVYIQDGATGIDVPASATQIKYTVESERTVINEVKLGTSQTDCLLPATLFEKPVYLADASLETCPTVTHDHREKTAANCTEKPVCAICVQEYDEALGHDHSGDWHNDADNHWKICQRSGCNEIIDKEAHVSDSGVVTTEPTETTEGVKTFKCVKCEYVMRTETIPPITPDHTHDYSSEWKSDNTHHWHECDCGEKTDVELHTEDSGTVTTEPTETTEGVKTFKCVKCGYVLRTETIPAKGGIPNHPYIPVRPVTPSTPTVNIFEDALVVEGQTEDDKVTLTWDKIDGATGYTVYLYKNTQWVKLKSTTRTDVTYKKLNNGKTYRFLVRYTKGGKLSPISSSGEYTAEIYYKPIVKAVSGTNSVRLSWKAVPGAEKYAVYKYVNGKAVKVKETEKLAFKFSKLKPGKKYRYIVRAYIDGKWTTVKKSDIVTVKTKTE